MSPQPDPLNLIITGAQGSGKGTQSRKLAQDFNLQIVEVGQIFREISAQDTQIGKYLRDMMRQGNLIPSDIVNKIVGEYLSQLEPSQGLIFDAYPREIHQWEYLQEYMHSRQTPVDMVIDLEIDDQTSLDRLQHRVNSKSTGKIFNLRTDPPPADWPAGDLIVRDDDKPEAIMHRLRQYHQTTEPILNVYKQEGILAVIDARKSIEEVHDAIRAALQDRGLVK